MNLAKHGVSFGEAETILRDPFIVVDVDEGHSSDEERLRATGLSDRRRLVVGIFALDRPGRLRLISARRATKRERHAYEESG